MSPQGPKGWTLKNSPTKVKIKFQKAMKKQNNFAKFNIFPAPAGGDGGVENDYSHYVGSRPYAGVFDPVGVGQWACG